jgi:trimethyllysine dioxygenase
MVQTFAIPQDIDIVDVVVGRDQAIRVQWSDGHVGRYPPSFLDISKPNLLNRNPTKLGDLQWRPFETCTPGQEQYPTVSYSAVMANDKAVLEWLENIYRWGFCFVKDTPVDPQATEALLNRIAFIRTTHYGRNGFSL